MNNADDTVNYDSDAVLELEIGGVEYRVDSGKQGTALCISTRSQGSWDWSFLGEAGWDGRDLKMRALDRELRVELSRALVDALESQQ
ncbi:MAG TPA: hypothetical protein PKA88_07140 [Polyangiaceae bacterium]|nr:hypothetical protein [Polyangiaceae bacterium]HMR78681.1 hypothetical protein [Polyangiaceae bacterium]